MERQNERYLASIDSAQPVGWGPSENYRFNICSSHTLIYGSSGNGSTNLNETFEEKKLSKKAVWLYHGRSNLCEIYLHGIASHSLSCSPCLFPRLSLLAGNRRRFVRLGFNLPVVSWGLKWPPRAGLPRLRMQGMQIWLQLDFLDEKRSGFKSQFVVGSRHQWIQD